MIEKAREAIGTPGRVRPPKSKPREQDTVTEPLQRQITEAGGKVLKMHGGPMSSGQPDLLGCIGGFTLAIETKRSGARGPTPHQSEIIRQWASAGALAFWTDNPDQAMFVILGFLKGMHEKMVN